MLLKPPTYLGIDSCDVLKVALACVEIEKVLAAPKAAPMPLYVCSLGAEISLQNTQQVWYLQYTIICFAHEAKI